MRNVDQGPGVGLDDRGIDRVAEWLDRRSDVHAWTLVIGSIALVATLDMSKWSFDMCAVPLYILPICLAAWMFRAATAIGIAALVTLIAFSKFPLLYEDASASTMVYSGVSRALGFALLTAIMLAFRRSHDRAHLAASIDRMTGALNKQTFHERTLSLLDAAVVSDRTVLLLYLDLDGFKAVNDRHGHHVGDEVLQTFVSGVSLALRSGDCIGRLGGDEFAVALITESSEEAVALAESLHGSFTSALASSSQSVTCSTGALIVPAGKRFPCAELMKTADQLMYASKNSGGNAVTIATAVATTLCAEQSSEDGEAEAGLGGAISHIAGRYRQLDRPGKISAEPWPSGSLARIDAAGAPLNSYSQTGRGPELGRRSTW